MAKDLDNTNTVPFGDDTMADLPVDYSFRDYRREAREKARLEALAAEAALAAAAAGEDDFFEMTDEESLDAIESFMAEEQQARAEEERVGRISSGILEKISGLTDEEFLKTQTMSRTAASVPKPAAPVSRDTQLPPPTPEEDDWPREDYRPLWLYWAIGITACLVVVALIYIITLR